MNQELMTAATLGTAQRELTGLDVPLLDQLDPADREKNVLVAAALLSVQSQAGWLIPQDQRPLAVPGEKDAGTPVDQRAIRHLLVMLNGHYSKVLPEWLKEVAREDRRVPEEILPMLLDAGRKNAELRDLILPVIGKRGRWLAEQAKDKKWDWFPLDDADIEKRWRSVGKIEELIELLVFLRRTTPAKARELMSEFKTTFKQKSYDAHLIRCFNIGLTMDDEPFLESVLDDKSPIVRKATANVLSRLPESRLQQRMKERAFQFFHFHKNQIVYELPDQLDAAAIRDGFAEIQTEDQETRRDWLVRMLEAVQPAIWRDRWKLTSEALVKAAFESDDTDLYLEAWAVAAERSSDMEMAVALLTAFFEQEHKHSFDLLLSATLSPQLLEKLATEILSKAASPLNNVVRGLLLVTQFPWSAELTRALLDNMRRYLHKGNTRPEPQIRADLLSYALYMPPAMREEIIRTLNVPTSAEKVWGEMIDEMRLLLDFRAEVLAALRS